MIMLVMMIMTVAHPASLVVPVQVGLPEGAQSRAVAVLGAQVPRHLAQAVVHHVWWVRCDVV